MVMDLSMEQTPTSRSIKCKKPNRDSPDVLSKLVEVCGHDGKNCDGKHYLNEAIQCDLCAAWVHASLKVLVQMTINY